MKTDDPPANGRKRRIDGYRPLAGESWAGTYRAPQAHKQACREGKRNAITEATPWCARFF